jgi:CHAT domain-containing protein/tetratricopeptide (TPR) repeat protein
MGFLDRLRRGKKQIGRRATSGATMKIPLRFQGHIARLQTLPNTAEGIEQQIAICEDILRSLTCNDAPLLWGAVQNQRGIAYRNRTRGDRTENLEQAIAAFTVALEAYTRTAFPVNWAMSQTNLGNAYADRIRGDRAENLEQAIAAFAAALEVYTRADFPTQWALVQHNLGNAYADRIRGNRAENLEQAITAYTNALKVRTRDDFPAQWALTQNHLGIALRDRIRGNRAQNLERAIAAYNVALQVYTRGGFPVEWAMTQNNLGNAYADRIRGSRAGNLERAVSAYTAALEVYGPDNLPVDWARIQKSLAIAYSDRIRGDQAENLEQAIAACTAALQVYTQNDFPVQWAATQSILGNALRERIRGNRAQNLERAITAYTAALEVYTRDEFPVEWAAIQHYLGNALRERIGGDQAENLEQAIAACQAALEVRTRNDFPVQWALTRNNLGTAYVDRIRGDRTENLERAITAFQSAMEVYTPEDSPVNWAMVQHNLGNAYANRIRGDRAENLEWAITAYTGALEVRTRDVFPVEWAMTQINLGIAYRNRIRGDRAENLEQAITAYTAALQVYTRSDYPALWAATQSNLGNALRERIRGDQAENLERAITACTAALEVYTRMDFPVEWVTAQINLGVALSDRIKGDRSGNLKQAIAAFQVAIDGAQAMSISDHERRAAAGLGSLHYGEGQWSAAYAAFDTAIAALEATRIRYFGEEARAYLAEKNTLLYARMTDTCLHLGCLKEALERAEAGKGRLFLDQLGTDAFSAPPLPPAQQALLERETGLLNELRSLEYAIRNAPDEDRWRQFVAQRGEKRGALDEVWAQLEPHAPDYVALRRGNPVKYDDLHALVDGFGPTAALVEFYTLPDRIVVFVVRSGERKPAVAQVPMPQEQLLRYVRTYWREVVEYPQRGNIGQRWEELADPLLADVLPHLQGAELIYLVPHGLLHYLPLHALQVDGDFLIDRFPIAYAPSAAALGRVIQRTAGMEQTGKGPRALVLGYTPYEHERAVFEGEAMQVAEFFGTEAHLGQEATRALLRERGAQYDTLHLSCHGFFDPTDPLASRLFLADGVLTARDIMGVKLNADLVTLSACQTALSGHQPGDELVGLTRSLLYAGASSVLVTLWSVNAVAALELMDDFYSRLRGKDGAKVTAEAVALRQAMLGIRKQREHPYYWAPFILVGDWR